MLLEELLALLAKYIGLRSLEFQGLGFRVFLIPGAPVADKPYVTATVYSKTLVYLLRPLYYSYMTCTIPPSAVNTKLALTSGKLQCPALNHVRTPTCNILAAGIIPVARIPRKPQTLLPKPEKWNRGFPNPGSQEQRVLEQNHPLSIFKLSGFYRAACSESQKNPKPRASPSP